MKERREDVSTGTLGVSAENRFQAM